MTLAAAAPGDPERIHALVRQARLTSDGIDVLLARLDEASWGARRDVIAALAALGDDAVAKLCHSLQHERTSETRIAATVDTLVASTGAVEDAVIALALSSEPAVVADVAQILGRRRKPHSVPTLIACLHHADDNVAAAAIEALGRVGGRAAVDALVETVERNYFFRTYPAIDVLGRSRDPRAVPPLAQLLRKQSYVNEVARALGRTADKAAVQPLAELLRSADPEDVRLAALSLAELLETYRTLYGNTVPIADALRRHAPEGTLQHLTQALTDADDAERIAVCSVLGVLQLAAAAPVLAQQLMGPPEVVHAAAAALTRLGPDAREYLHQAVLSGNSAQRQLLLPLLSGTGRSPAIEACLQDPDPSVRALACDAAASMGDGSVVNTLFILLKDSNARVAQAAMRAIQSLHTAETKQLALAAARSSAPAERRSALRILSYFGFADALDVFSEALQDPDPRVRDVAIAGLAFIEHPRALALLLETAASASAQARTAAVRGLGQTTATPETLETLRKATSDSEAWVRYYACQALGKLGVLAAVDEISSLLKDSAGQVRVAAIEALAQLKSPAALDVLRAAADQDDADLQRAALIGIGVMKDPVALPSLLSACAALEAATRQVALSALSEFASDETLPVVAHALSDPDEGVRSTAIGVLTAWPQAGATAALIDAMGDNTLQARIMDALATPAPGRIAGILSALASADDESAPLLTALFARLDPKDRTGAVFEALRSDNAPARKAAAALLAAHGSHEALAALTRQASEDPSEEVRRVCALLLAQ